MSYLDKDGFIRGATRELRESQEELAGWADRVMDAILYDTIPKPTGRMFGPRDNDHRI